jgi:hypothetical protein
MHDFSIFTNTAIAIYMVGMNGPSFLERIWFQCANACQCILKLQYSIIQTTVKNCIFFDGSVHQIEVLGCHEISICGNQFYGCQAVGLYLRSSTCVKVRDNFFELMPCCIEITNTLGTSQSGGYTISGNFFNNATSPPAGLSTINQRAVLVRSQDTTKGFGLSCELSDNLCYYGIVSGGVFTHGLNPYCFEILTIDNTVPTLKQLWNIHDNVVQGVEGAMCHIDDPRVLGTCFNNDVRELLNLDGTAPILPELVNATATITGDYFAKSMTLGDTTNSTSTSTGAVIVSGGMGILKNINVGGVSKFMDTVDSSSTSTGSLKIAGGLGVAKDLYAGANVRILGNADTFGATTGALVVTGGIGANALECASSVQAMGIIRASSTLEASTTSTGGLLCTGGIGVAKSIVLGGVLKGTLTTDSADSTTGACIFAGGVGVAKNLNIGGTLVKGGGSFQIPHPDPSKQGWKLRHCFVESPTRGDNLYRFKVETKGLKASISLPDYFKFINEDVQVFVSPKCILGNGCGIVSDDLAKVDISVSVYGVYNVLVIGTRKDELMHKYWDEFGAEIPPQ